ncbi:hypothetical protein [Streptomyces sp. NPDC005970]
MGGRAGEESEVELGQVAAGPVADEFQNRFDEPAAQLLGVGRDRR